MGSARSRLSLTDPLLQRYLATLKHERKLSALTLEAYYRDLSQLQHYADKYAGSASLSTLTQQQLRLFATRIQSKGLAPSSMARTLSAWRGFYSWLTRQTEPALALNPALGLRAPRRAKRLPKALSVEHAQVLANHTGTGIEGLRNHTLCELFYSSGLRLAELVQLDWRYFSTATYQSTGWLDLENAELTVLGKGGKRRTIPIGSYACAALRNWLESRPESVNPKYTPDPYALFLSPRGGRITRNRVQQSIKTLALAAGIPANVHPHVLRHSCASHLLQSSGDLRAVQEMLGHAQITSTQIYTALDFQHLAKVYDNAHPRAKRKP